LLGLMLLPTPAPASDGEPARDPGVYEKAVDLVLVRPLGLVPIAFGLLMLPLAYPATWLTEGSLDVPGVCLEAPLAHTFRRPLGEL
jgi:hypothetical protein